MQRRSSHRLLAGCPAQPFVLHRSYTTDEADKFVFSAIVLSLL